MHSGSIGLSYDTEEYRLEGQYFWTNFPGPDLFD